MKDPLFEPIRIRGMEVKNRICMPAMHLNMTPNYEVTAQLIDATTGNHLWAERYDREMKDIFAVQDEITLKVITALQVRLTEGEQARLFERWTKNLDVYLKILQARDNLFHPNVQTVAAARRLAQEAIAKDPACAAAYRILGNCAMHEMLLGVSKDPKESLAEAIKTIQKAIGMGDDSSFAHGTLSFLYALAMKYDEAISEGERAVAVEPNSADGHAFLAYSLRYAGKHEEAISRGKTAILLNPIAPEWYFRTLGLAYSMAGQHQEAISMCEKAVRLAPNSLYPQISLTMAYGIAGHEAEARRQAVEVLRVDPKFSVDAFAKRAFTYKKQEDRDRSVEALRKAGLN